MPISNVFRLYLSAWLPEGQHEEGMMKKMVCMDYGSSKENLQYDIRTAEEESKVMRQICFKSAANPSGISSKDS